MKSRFSLRKTRPFIVQLVLDVLDICQMPKNGNLLVRTSSSKDMESLKEFPTEFKPLNMQICYKK